MILQQNYDGIRVRNNFEDSGQYYNITSLTVSSTQQVRILLVSIPTWWIMHEVNNRSKDVSAHFLQLLDDVI